MPADFPDMFVLLGWEAIEDHYTAGQRAIKRWLRQCGEEDILTRRRSYLRKLYASRGLAGIPGRKPGRTIGAEIEQPAGSIDRANFPLRRLKRAFRGNVTSR
jgi:hypothetical protein